MNAKHTPGPWVVEEEDTYQGDPSLTGASIHGRNGGTFVAEVRGAIKIDGLEHQENAANAGLIAVAPEFYEFTDRISKIADIGENADEDARLLAALKGIAAQLLAKVDGAK